MSKQNNTTKYLTIIFQPSKEEKSKVLHKEGKSQSEIARELGRHRSTISRELKRGIATQMK